MCARWLLARREGSRRGAGPNGGELRIGKEKRAMFHLTEAVSRKNNENIITPSRTTSGWLAVQPARDETDLREKNHHSHQQTGMDMKTSGREEELIFSAHIYVNTPTHAEYIQRCSVCIVSPKRCRRTIDMPAGMPRTQCTYGVSYVRILPTSGLQSPARYLFRT